MQSTEPRPVRLPRGISSKLVEVCWLGRKSRHSELTKYDLHNFFLAHVWTQSFVQVLLRILEYWKTERENLLKQRQRHVVKKDAEMNDWTHSMFNSKFQHEMIFVNKLNRVKYKNKKTKRNTAIRSLTACYSSGLFCIFPFRVVRSRTVSRHTTSIQRLGFRWAYLWFSTYLGTEHNWKENFRVSF